MNKNSNNNINPISLFPHETLNYIKKINSPDTKRPISALLNLKIFRNDLGTDQTKLQIKNFKRDLSLEQLQRQRINFNKTFILPEIEAKNQSYHQYIENLDGFYETINNDKNEEFLPFYTINLQKPKITRKFICLNRRTVKSPKKMFPLEKTDKSNNNLLYKQKFDLTSTSEKMKPKKIKLVKKKSIEKENKLDKSELELIDLLLQKESNMNKNNFNRVFALTEKEKEPTFPKKNITNNEKNLNTFNVNTCYEGYFNTKTQKSVKVNFFQNHLNELKQRNHCSEHHNSKNATITTRILEDKLKIVALNKNFNFSKPQPEVSTQFLNSFKPMRTKKLDLNSILKEKDILIQNVSDLKQTSRRTDNLQGWNEVENNGEEEVFL